MKQGKVWGSTIQIFGNAICELHRIDIKRGGYCSKHRHNQKANGFFLEDGLLLVRVWKKDYPLMDETILYPGDFTVVMPGEYHQFEALEDCIAFEFYWAECLPSDIEREICGGKQDKSLEIESGKLKH